MGHQNQCLLKECYHICENNYNFEGNDCILYCGKHDWYEEVNGVKDWSKSAKDIKRFWNLIYVYNENNKKLSFKKIVFPKFLKNLKSVASDKFNNYYVENKIVEFRGCIFEDDVFLENILFTKRVSFAGSVFNGNVVLTNSIFGDIVDFTKAKFNGEVILENTYLLNSIYLNNVIIRNKFIFIARRFQIDNYKRNKELFNYLKKLEEDEKIKDDNFKEIENIHKGYSLRHLHLKNTILDKDSFVEFRGFYKKQKENNSYEIENMKLSTLEIENFINYSKSFKLNNIEVGVAFNIINSNLGTTEFNNMDFSKDRNLSKEKYKTTNKKENPYKIQFKDSSLVDTKFNNIKWDEEKNIRGDREDFRQLKNVLDAQSNYIDANLMHRKELEQYHKNLINEKKSPFKTRLVLGFSKFISNHSNSFWKPFIYFIVWSLIAFGVYMELVKEYFIKDTIYYLGLFMNPFTIKIPDELHLKNTLLWWVFYKTISAFILYHFVVALKRKVKR